jgi:hypothetical protein
MLREIHLVGCSNLDIIDKSSSLKLFQEIVSLMLWASSFYDAP